MCFVSSAVAALPTYNAVVLHPPPIKLVLVQQFMPTLENATHGPGLLKYTPREAKREGQEFGASLGYRVSSRPRLQISLDSVFSNR